MQQVEVPHPLEGIIEACQREAGLQQWNVERCAVIGDDQVELLQQVAQRIKHRWLFIEVADEVLDHLKAAARKVTDADKKRTDSGAALNACCFGVEENNPVAFAHTEPLFGEIHQALEFVR